VKIARFGVVALALTAAGCGGSTGNGAATAIPTAPSAPAPPVVPPSCKSITTPGSYVLDADLGASGNAAVCLSISASDVTVDCRNHTVNGNVSIATGLSNVSVADCAVAGGFAKATNISNVTIAGTTATNIIFIVGGHHVTLDHDQFTVLDGRPGGVVILQNGDHNQVIGNVLDGGYHGHDLSGSGNDAPGADDGVIIDNEADDLIQGNFISNVFDAGVEGLDLVSTTTIANNTFSNAVLAGVGAYWCTHWDGNVVSGNTSNNSVYLVLIKWQSGSLCSPSPPDGLFTRNSFVGNSLRGQLRPGVPGMYFPLSSITSAVSGNLISQNDVGQAPIFLAPLAGFVDGGGNICGAGGTISC
jgi:hypothetical protein